MISIRLSSTWILRKKSKQNINNNENYESIYDQILMQCDVQFIKLEKYIILLWFNECLLE
jgi:hypothetical protein